MVKMVVWRLTVAQANTRAHFHSARQYVRRCAAASNHTTSPVLFDADTTTSGSALQDRTLFTHTKQRPSLLMTGP